MISKMPDYLVDGLGKRVVVSRRLVYQGWGTLVGLDSYGEGHFAYMPLGYEGDLLIDDLTLLLDGGVPVDDMAGKALLNTDGSHEYFPFSQITDRGLVKVQAKFFKTNLWLAPPKPGDWSPRTTVYRDDHGSKLHTVSLQGYNIPEKWEYTDFESLESVSVEPVYFKYPG